MRAREIKPGIFWVGVNDRATDLFEGLWPISKGGVSYNSYLVVDEKKALIDLAKSIKGDEFFAQIEEVTDVSTIDYVILNHMEPDHTGLLRILRKMAPRAEILGSARTQEMLKGFFGIQEGVRAVGDGETLSLGAKTLRFISTPFVHWPETIMTYETAERVLFSCDGFGGFGTLDGFLFDDECRNLDDYVKEALRYYANIVANYSPRVLEAIAKLAGTPIDIVAPSHGLVWRADPRRIVDLYKKWAEYGSGEVEPGITLVYGSMYGYTEMMMNCVAEGIIRAGVDLEIFDAGRTHYSHILPSLWTKKGVMIGAPTYEVRLFPPVAEALNMAVSKRVVNRRAAYFGSYGWSGGALRELRKIIEPAKWELKEVFEFIGCPSKDDLQKGVELGTRFAEQIKSAP